MWVTWIDCNWIFSLAIQNYVDDLVRVQISASGSHQCADYVYKASCSFKYNWVPL